MTNKFLSTLSVMTAIGIAGCSQPSGSSKLSSLSSSTQSGLTTSSSSSSSTSGTAHLGVSSSIPGDLSSLAITSSNQTASIIISNVVPNSTASNISMTYAGSSSFEIITGSSSCGAITSLAYGQTCSVSVRIYADAACATNGETQSGGITFNYSTNGNPATPFLVSLQGARAGCTSSSSTGSTGSTSTSSAPTLAGGLLQVEFFNDYANPSANGTPCGATPSTSGIANNPPATCTLADKSYPNSLGYKYVYVRLTNVGDTPLTLTGVTGTAANPSGTPPSGNNRLIYYRSSTGSPVNGSFPGVTNNSTTLCSTSTPMAVGASCFLSIIFNPEWVWTYKTNFHATFTSTPQGPASDFSIVGQGVN